MIASAAQPPDTGKSANQSITRASRLLRCFVDSPQGLTLTELARRSGLHTSTVHRMMAALVEGGLVAKGEGDKYRPGIALLALGASASLAVGVDAALPFLDELSQRTGESASLAVKDADCAVVLLETESPQRLISRYGVGSRNSLQDSAHGQILLAYAQDPEAAVRRLARPIVRGGEYTDAEELIGEILDVRRRGYSFVSDGEQATLSVPVPAPDDGPVTRALGIAAPSRRLTGRSIDSAVAAAIEIAHLLRGVRT